jgi:hypothetical protein
MVVAALNQVVRRSDATMPVSGTRGSGKYTGTVAGVSLLALNTDDRRVGHPLAQPLADQPNPTIHEGARR